MKQFDLIVIGAGISGMAVAMRAIEAGMRVAVVDDHATVGEGASFFHSGVVLPPPLDPWFGPDAAVPTPGGVPWRRNARERAADAVRHARLAPLQPLIAQSASRLDALSQRYDIDFERRDGALYVWRHPTAFQRVKDLIAAWPTTGRALSAAPSDSIAATDASDASDASDALVSSGAVNAVDAVLDEAAATAEGQDADVSHPVECDATPHPQAASDAIPSPHAPGAPDTQHAPALHDAVSGSDVAASAAPPIDMYGHRPRVLDAEACRTMEPALEHAEALAGGLAFDGLTTGNAAVMAKRLKQCLDAADVSFLLARQAIRIEVHASGVDVSIRPAQQAVGAFSGVQARGFTAPSTTPILGLDARQTDPAQHVEKIRGTNVVIAAGAGSAKLLGDAGIALPLQRVTRSTLTGTVLREDYAPRHLVVDAENGAAIVRFDRRVRVSSCLYGQAATIGKVSGKGAGLPPGPPSKALQALPAQLHRWRDTLVPGAARFDGPPGESLALVGADGLPVIGTLNTRQSGGRLHLVLSGAHRGWGLAFGAADLLFAQWGHAAQPRTEDGGDDVRPVTAEARDANETFDSAARMALSPARFGH